MDTKIDSYIGPAGSNTIMVVKKSGDSVEFNNASIGGNAEIGAVKGAHVTFGSLLLEPTAHVNVNVDGGVVTIGNLLDKTGGYGFRITTRNGGKVNMGPSSYGLLI